MDWGSAVTYFGSTTLKQSSVKFGVKDDDRAKHMCVLGKADTAREEFLAQVALQDIKRAIPLVLIDLSGETSKLIVERLDEDELERLIYLDAGDADYPYAFNPIEEIKRIPASQSEKERRLSELIVRIYNIDRGVFPDYVAGELLKHDNATLAGLFSLVTDEKARTVFFEGNDEGRAGFESLLEENAVIQEHFDESGKYIAKDTLVRNLFGQTVSKFSLIESDHGAPIVLVDLSRVRIYPTRATPIVRSWVEVARTAGYVRGAPVSLLLQDCLRYLDEEHIDSIFSDQDIAITVADASFGEGEKEKREKALSRCGSIASFAAHTTDRALIERAFYPYVNPEELNEVGEREILVALTIDAVRAKPFFGSLLPLPPRKNTSYQDALLTSRDRYANTRLSVDEAIRSAFKPKPRDDASTDTGRRGKGGTIDDEDDDDEDDSFASTFRSIFKPQANGDGASHKKSPSSTPPKEGGAPSSGGKKGAPPEIPEDELKEMLYVHPRFA